MKHTVYVYDSETGCKSTRFIEAMDEVDAMSKAFDGFCKDYHISDKSPTWRFDCVTVATDINQAYWLW